MATPAPYSDKYLDDVKPPKGFFDQFRVGNFPTLYPSILTSVTADVLETGWIFAACILVFSLLLVIPGIRRTHGRWTAFLRIVIAVGFWVFIILCNFGQDWEVAHIKKARTQYKALLPGEIEADIGVRIGLRSVNISLLGRPRIQQLEKGLLNETIDYNERFSWNNDGWLVGRPGFGPYAGLFNQEFREAQRRGAPYPILWIAEYFTVDGEGLRWGRHYLQAGYFTHIFVWTAWAMWMLALVLFNMVPRYGGYFSFLTGLSLIIADVIYGTLRNANQLAIPFYFDGCRKNTSDVGDHRHCLMEFHFSWCFWLCLGTGISCVVIGVSVVLMDLLIPETLAEFFNVDITEDYEEFVITADDGNDTVNTSRTSTLIPMVTVSDVQSTSAAGTSGDTTSDAAQGSTHTTQHGFRKRTVRGFGGIQKTHKTAARMSVLSIQAPDQGEEYEDARTTVGPSARRTNRGAAKNDRSSDDQEDYVNLKTQGPRRN